MKKTPLISVALVFILAFFGAVSVQAQSQMPNSGNSVTTGLFYDETTGTSFTINDGDQVGLLVSADSIFEKSMTIKVELLGSKGEHVSTLLTVQIADSNIDYCYNIGSGRGCNYFDHLVVTKASYAKSGTYTIVSTVVGASGQSATDQLSLTVKPLPIVNRIPVVTSSPVTQVNEGASYSYKVTATDADNDVLTYGFDISNTASWLSIDSSTGLITGTAPLVNKDTVYPVTVIVSDGKAAATHYYDLTVRNVANPNQIPVITSSPVTQVNENSGYAYDVDASDADNDVLIYSLIKGPDWLSIDSATGLVTGTAPNVNADTNFDVVVSVSDGKSNVSQSYTLTVIDVPVANNAPVASDQSVVTDENVTVNIALQATDADGDAFVYVVVGNPSNGILSGFNSQTGIVMYTPNTGFSGSDSFMFKANDGKEDSNIATVTITVNKAITNNAPVITSSPVTEVDENELYRYQVTATDVDGDTLIYGITGPNWLSIDSATGLVTGTAPQVSSDTDFNVTILVSDGTDTTTQDYIISVRDISSGGKGGGSSGGGTRIIPADKFEQEKYFGQFEPVKPIIIEESEASAKGFSSLKLFLFILFLLILISLSLIIFYLIRG